MKKYVLALASSDFTKVNKKWSSDSIDLYNNISYTNYSIMKSRYGLNLLGDYTFVGTEVQASATPTLRGSATPLFSTVHYVTDYGEVVADRATPTFNRFVDTTSRVDILTFRGSFLNTPGTETPSFTLNVYESDFKNGPWMASVIETDTNLILINSAKRYVKFEVNILSEVVDVSSFDFLLLVEIAVHNPEPSIISNAARNILDKFPSWSAVYEDSIAGATPSLQKPTTVGGKLVTSLVGESLENFQSLLDRASYNAYINTADEAELDWVYLSTGVPSIVLDVKGDDVHLATTQSAGDLYANRKSTYAYYFSPSDRSITTLRKFDVLKVNGQVYTQTPVLVFNIFDEFGSRVGLQRLYLESNANFKKRILDVYQHLPASNLEAFKLTVRRELDLWRAFGSTPDSNFLGATPEVLELSDIERSSEFFNDDFTPKPKFISLVERLNKDYPSNWGYAKWGSAAWDYAGLKQEGVSYIDAIYDIDELASPNEIYQPGVGDLSDAKFSIKYARENNSVENVSVNLKLKGKQKTGTTLVTPEVVVPIDVYGSYYATTDTSQSATVNYTIELDLLSPATPNKYYANHTIYPRNKFSNTHSASPEFTIQQIFSESGFTIDELYFYQYNTNIPYIDYRSTPNVYAVNIDYVDRIRINNGHRNALTGTYSNSNSNNFWLRFEGATPYTGQSHLLFNTASPGITIASPNIDYRSSAVLAHSDIYTQAIGLYYTEPIRKEIKLNSKEHQNTVLSGVSGLQIPRTDFEFSPGELTYDVIFPIKSQPLYYYLEAPTIEDYSYQDSPYIDPAYAKKGGIAYHGERDKTYLVPASPNIKAQFIPANFATPSSHFGYISTSASTVNYHWNQLYYPCASTPGKIRLYLDNYNFNYTTYADFEASLATPITASLDKYGVISGNYANKDVVDTTRKDLIMNEDLTRASFGITSSEKNYILDSIHVDSVDNADVRVWMDYTHILPAFGTHTTNATPDFALDVTGSVNRHAPTELVEEYDVETGKYKIKNVKVRAEVKQEKTTSQIHTGWFSFKNEDYYVYANPVTETYTNPGLTVELSDVARQGAPILVSLQNLTNGSSPNIELTEVAFVSNSGTLSITNIEVVKAGLSRNLYLAYPDVYNVTVKDVLTDTVVASNLSSATNVIQVFPSADPSRYGRDYEVSYKVRNTFTAENNYYNSLLNKTKTLLTFDSTPSFSQRYSVTYEGSIYETATPVSLDLMKQKTYLDQGYIYLDNTSYNFGSIDITADPGEIKDDGIDFCFVSVYAYDENENPMARQKFTVSGSGLTISPSTIITDEDGYAYVKVKYSGSALTAPSVKTLTVSGVTDSSGSKSGSISRTIDINVGNKASSTGSAYRVYAIADPEMIIADNKSVVTIKGIVVDANGAPVPNVVVYWRKGRTFKSVFDVAYSTTYRPDAGSANTSGYVVTSNYYPNYGKFTVKITSQDYNSSGHWVVALDTAISASASSNPTTIAGDIVKWKEEYDYVVFPNRTDPISIDRTVSDSAIKYFYATPMFWVDHRTGEPATPNASSLVWKPPKWVPISRYDQYQLGELGSTYYTITNYTNIRPDGEDEV